MKDYVIKPTSDNILNSLLNDSIGRNKFLINFINLINLCNDSYSVFLDANWGSGKTFFVNQVKMIFDAYNNESNSSDDERAQIKKIFTQPLSDKNIELIPHVSVYYDAWANDNDEDPMLSLVYSILQDLNEYYSFTDRSALNIATSILDVFTGHSIKTVVDSLKGEDPFSNIKSSKRIERLVNDFLEELLSNRGKRLVVFVDELDRCKPSYAVKLLERIKHYFCHNKITFVFSVNTRELQHSIKKYYGDELDATRYIERFYDYKVELPSPDLTKMYNSYKFPHSSYIYDKVCEAVVKVFNFETREIAKFYQLTYAAAYDVTHSKGDFMFDDALYFCILHLIPVMLALKMHNSTSFDAFIAGRDSTPMKNVFDRYLTSNIQHLFEKVKIMEEKVGSKKDITHSDVLDMIYNAVFATDYNENTREILVGDLHFHENIKKELIIISGLMSNYNNYN